MTIDHRDMFRVIPENIYESRSLSLRIHCINKSINQSSSSPSSSHNTVITNFVQKFFLIFLHSPLSLTIHLLNVTCYKAMHDFIILNMLPSSKTLFLFWLNDKFIYSGNENNIKLNHSFFNLMFFFSLTNKHLYVKGNMQCLSFRISVTSLRIVVSSSIQLPASFKFSFRFK